MPRGETCSPNVAVSPPVIVAETDPLTVNEKSKVTGGGSELTMRLIVAVFVIPPPEAEKVMGYVPTGVELVVPNVSKEVYVGLPDGGLKLYVIPVGRLPGSERVTVTGDPAIRFAFTV